jgi:branched-chain amino acid transport system substrate-binding protein
MRLLAAVLVLSALLCGCGSSAPSNTVVAPPASAVNVKIGVIAPIDGGLTSFGRGIRNSVALAVSQANNTNLVPGVNFVMDARDDSSTPSIGAAAAASLAQDPTVAGVVGTYNSGVAAETIPILDAASIVQISPGNTNPTLTLGPDPNNPVRPNANYFRVVVPDSIQGPALADYAFDTLGIRRVSILTEFKAVSQNLANAFSAQFTARGGTILTHQVAPEGTTNYGVQLAAIAAFPNRQLLFYAGEFDGGARVRLQANALGMTEPIMGGDGLKDDLYITNTAGAANGDYASTVGAPLAALPGGADFLAAYNALGFAEPPTDFGPYAFDAANAIIQAVAQARAAGAGFIGAKRFDNIARVQATSFTGVTGPVSFNAFGDTNNKVLTIYRVVGGQWVAQQTITR